MPDKKIEDRDKLLKRLGTTCIVIFEDEKVKCGIIGFVVKVMTGYMTIKISSTKNETVVLEDIELDKIRDIRDYRPDI